MADVMEGRAGTAARPAPPASNGGVALPRLRSSAVWRDLAALAALVLLTRLPFQTTVLYHWDGVLYARALAGFDVSESQPHPPGYLFYVAAARLADLALHDANASLVAVSILGSALAVACTYLVGRLLLGRGVGVLAALLLATAPPFWFYSGVAYPYTLLAAGSAGLTALAVAYARGRWCHPAALGWLYGLAGGFRLDLLIFLAPLLVVVHLARCFRTRRWHLWLAPLPGVVAGTLLWLVPTAQLSGGWDVYLPLLFQQGRYVESSYSLWARGLAAVQSNGWQVLVYAAEGLQLALVPLIYGAVSGLWQWRRSPRRLSRWDEALAPLTLALWLAPPVLFYTFVHIGDRGYSFSYLPALCVLAAAGVQRLGRDLRAVRLGVRGWTVSRSARPLAGPALAALLLAANVGAFLWGGGRMSARELDCVNRTLHASLRVLREEFDPADTLLFSSFFYQHARYYLPEFRAWWYDPLTRPVFREPLPPDVRRVVVFGEGLWAARQPNVSYYALPCDRRLYYVFSVAPGAQLVYRPPLLSVRPSP